MSNAISALQHLLETQERLDRLIAATFRRCGPRLIDLSYANPSDGPSAEVLSILARAATETTGRSLQYSPIAGRAASRRAVAAAIARRFDLPFGCRDVFLTAGAMPALNIVSRALFDAGDEVIVLTPAWQDYPLYLRNLGARVRLVPLRADKHFDLDAIGAAIGPATRGIFISQPCCPTGVVYSRTEIEQLASILTAAERRLGIAVYLISDEVHRDVIWNGTPFHSPLQSYPRSISVYSFGKAFAMQGQRVGYLAVSPRMRQLEAIRIAIERCVRLMGFGHPTATMQRAVCDLVECRPVLEPLARAQRLVRRSLTSCGYDVCDGDASFYVYVTSPLPDAFAFAELLALRGVLVIPSNMFHEPGYVRLALTARHEALEAALPVFAAALAETRGAPACSSRC